MIYQLLLLVALLVPTYFTGLVYPATLLVVVVAWLGARYADYRFKSRAEVELNKAFIEKIKSLESDLSERIRVLDSDLAKVNLALKLRDQVRR